MYNPAPPTVSTGGGHYGAAMASTITSITLRVATIAFTLIAFAIIASNKGRRSGLIYNYFTDTFLLWWQSWKMIRNSAAAFLLAANVIVCFYSIVQLVVSLVRGCMGARVLAGPTTPASTITFVFDQAMTYLMMGACGAGACHAVYNSRLTMDGTDVCDSFRVFCDKQIAAVVMSFLAFVSIALSAALHYFRVYKMATKLA